MEDEEQLYNMVNKTINHETRSDGGDAWRKAAGFTNVAGCINQPAFHNFIGNLLDDTEWNYEIVNGASTPIRIPTLAYWNEGVVYTGYTAQTPSYTSWSDLLNMNAIELGLHNDYMAPFITSSANPTGRFDKGFTCFGEFITRYDSIRGAIGYVGASRETYCNHSNPVVIGNLYLHESFAYYLFGEKRSIAGDLMLQSQMKSTPVYPYHIFPNAARQTKYAYNLFGDPALNILADPDGCRILVGTLTTNIVINAGECYTVPKNSVLSIGSTNSITINEGGLLMIEDNAKITSAYSQHDTKRFINIQGGTVAIGDNVVIENIRFLTKLSVSDVQFNNVEFIRSYPNTSVFDMNNCHFSNSNVLLNNHNHNANVTNSTFTDTKIHLLSAKDAIPIVMKFDNVQFNGSPVSHSSHKLEAINCTFFDRSDIIATHTVTDIKNCRFWKSGFKAGIPSEIPMPSAFTPFIKITNSSFRNTGKFIIGYDMLEKPIYSTAAIMLDGIKEFQIVGDTIINANAVAPKGIDPGGNQAQTSPYGEGIYLNNAGSGSANNQQIMNTRISQCETGLYVYNSKVQVFGNEIFNNVYGARLFNNSKTAFTGYNGVIGFCNYQIIRDNTSYELYTSENAFPIPFKYNQIIDNSNGGNWNNEPLIYYDWSQGNYSPFLDVTCNYWESGSYLKPFLYPYQLYISNPVWDKNSLCDGGKAAALYQSGMDYFDDEDYAAAKSAFMELIETEPQSEYAIASLHELFSLEQFLSEDYATLHNYYTTFTPADSTLFDVADFLATRCNVADQNWQPAIDWYEDRIANPPSYPDSIFAVIDLGDIHLAMESDTLNLKAGRIFRYPNLIPKSRRDYEENKSELLATLPKIDKPQPQHPLAETGKKGVLNQNIPNPAKGSTTVVYDVIKEGAVELRVYNQLGQLLQSLPQGTKREGSYNIEISLVGLPAGMYHYILFIDGEKADAKKLIVN